MKFALLFFLTHFAAFVFLFGQQDQSDSYAFAAQLSALKVKSAAHEKEIEALLSVPELQPTDFDIAPPVTIPSPQPLVPPNQVPPSPYLPVPDYNEVKETNNAPLGIEEAEYDTPASQSSATSFAEGLDLNNSDDKMEKVNSGDDADKILFMRHEGYYFGPLLGFVIPDDGAVRDLGIGNKIKYDSDTGYFIGIQFGKDFGSIRWEVEYSHLGFDGQGSGTNFEISTHDFMTRLVLEREIGELIDLRGGLGMGIGFISIENNQDYSGESFVYDLGIGASYRLRENMNLSLDYRYFLSAAEDRYDRLKGHIFTASANFDL